MPLLEKSPLEISKETVCGTIIVFWLLSIVIISFAGCATPKPLSEDEGVKVQISNSAATVEKSEKPKEEDKIFLEQSGQYRLVRTPFGFVKRPPESRIEGKIKDTPLAQQSQASSFPEVNATAAQPESIAENTSASHGPPEKPGTNGVPEEAGLIVFNFEDAELDEVIRTVAELLKINYIIDPGIEGKVTIHTARELRKEDLFPVFFQILEVNGLTAVEEGSLYKIIKIEDVPRMPIVPRFGREGETALPGERIIIQIIPLKYISAQEITKLLTPFISSEGTIVSHEGSNTLVVVDKGINILKILNLVGVFDVDLFKELSHRFYTFEYADAEDMARILRDIFGSYGTVGKAEVKFIAISRLNTLLVMTARPQVFDKVEQFIQKLNVPSKETEPKIYVYYVKNGEAQNLADLLHEVFVSKSTEKGKVPGGKTKEAQEETEKAVPKAKGVTLSSGVGTLRGEVSITPDTIRNSLIIEALPADYRTIEDILKSLDVLPRQVLIEVSVAEVSLDESTKLGVEWTYLKGPDRLSTSLLNAAIGSSGLRFTIGQADRWAATLEALASQNKVNILSSPSILASDNKEARIDISTEIPVASAEYQYTSGTEPVLQTNIQYRNTGVLLSVTPHINERGLVSMDINQEVSELSESVLVGGKDYPSFFKRSVDTSLTVQHGQTIVIGGLIKDKKSLGVAGVPCLVGIPVIRYLFGKETRSSGRTELIILLTPRVIASLEDVDAVTEEFKNKVRTIIKELSKEAYD